MRLTKSICWVNTADQYDLSPVVSQSGKRVAVTTFRFNKWTGEIENLKTDIMVMNTDKKQGPLNRKKAISNGGWPSWGSDHVIFFHRGIDKTDPANGKVTTTWGVFRYDLNTHKEERVTPEDFDAMTPAAINETKVAVATIRIRTNQMAGQRAEPQYRHIEIFDITKPNQPVKVTQVIFPLADYYNPFILDGGSRVGYHRGRNDKMVKQQVLLLISTASNYDTNNYHSSFTVHLPLLN